MADIIMNGTDQVVVCPLVDTNWAAVTTAVSDLAINMIINGGSDVDLVTAGATLTYSAAAKGHKLVFPHASISATGRYTCTITGTNIQTYILDGLIIGDSSHVISPTVAYNQVVKTTKIHPIQIKNLVTGELETSITGATYKYRINGGTETVFSPSPDPSLSYSNTMMSFLLTVPSTLAATAYDTVEINCSCIEGEGLLVVNVVPDSTTTSPVDFLSTTIRPGRSVAETLRILEIMLGGTVTGLTNGLGSPVTFTGADGSTVIFVVDENGNRAISSINLV